MPVFDFANVKELEAVDAGKYRCIIADAPKKSGPKGEYYAVKMTIQDEEYPELEGRPLYRNVSVSPKSLWAFKQFCLAAGSDPELFAGPVDTDAEMASRIGMEVDCTVIIKDYLKEGEEEPKKVNEIIKVEAPGF